MIYKKRHDLEAFEEFIQRLKRNEINNYLNSANGLKGCLLTSYYDSMLIFAEYYDMGNFGEESEKYFNKLSFKMLTKNDVSSPTVKTDESDDDNFKGLKRKKTVTMDDMFTKDRFSIGTPIKKDLSRKNSIRLSESGRMNPMTQSQPSRFSNINKSHFGHQNAGIMLEFDNINEDNGMDAFDCYENVYSEDFDLDSYDKKHKINAFFNTLFNNK